MQKIIGGGGAGDDPVTSDFAICFVMFFNNMFFRNFKHVF